MQCNPRRSPEGNSDEDPAVLSEGVISEQLCLVLCPLAAWMHPMLFWSSSFALASFEIIEFVCSETVSPLMWTEVGMVRRFPSNVHARAELKCSYVSTQWISQFAQRKQHTVWRPCIHYFSLLCILLPLAITINLLRFNFEAYQKDGRASKLSDVMLTEDQGSRDNQLQF